MIRPSRPSSADGSVPGRPAEVRLLSALLGVCGVTALLGAVAPMTPQAPVRLNASLSALAVVLLVVVWWSRRRGWLHVGLVSVVLGVSCIVAAAATGAGAAGLAISYVWAPLYAGFFFSRRVARAYAGLTVAAFATALLLNPFPGALHVWVLTALTSVTAAEAVGSISGRLHQQAATDPLTGVLNRDGLHRAAARLLAEARAARTPVTLVLVDLDGFKLVNDEQGHVAGDRLLQDLPASWRPLLRRDDVVARYGGDEFVLLLPATDAVAAALLLDRLADVSPTAWSCGTATSCGDGDLDALVLAADADLYRCKAARPGRPALRVAR